MQCTASGIDVTKCVKPQKIIKINLGTGLDGTGFVKEFEDSRNIYIGEEAKYVLLSHNFHVSIKPVEVYMAILSVADLGFKDYATYEDICERAILSGYKLCPNEAGPQFRKQYEEESHGEGVTVAMLPIVIPEFGLGVFNIWRTLGLLNINCVPGNIDKKWCAEHHFLFTVPERVLLQLVQCFTNQK